MKLKTAAVNATTDDGHKVGGPYFLPLTAEAKDELRELQREYGPLDKPEKPA